MVVRLNAFANHMYTKLNGIGKMTEKLFWYARNAAKRRHCLLILIPLGSSALERINGGADMNGKTCKTCIENDNGLCDRKGILIEEDDTCEKHTASWKEAMMENFIRKSMW